MRKRVHIICGLALAALAGVYSAPADALMLIEESTAPNHAANTKIDDEASLNVPSGTRIRLFLMQNGQTYVVYGPHKGTLAEYRKKRSTWWSRLKGKFWSETGQGDAQTEGGVRSVTPK